MSALPNPLNVCPPRGKSADSQGLNRKSPSKAAGAGCKERTHLEVSKAYVGNSSYDRYDQWAAFERIFLRDVAWIQSGAAQMFCLFYIKGQIERNRKKGAAAPQPEVVINKKDLAKLMIVDIHSVNMSLKSLVSLGVAIVDHHRGVKATVRLILRPETINGKEYRGLSAVAEEVATAKLSRMNAPPREQSEDFSWSDKDSDESEDQENEGKVKGEEEAKPVTEGEIKLVKVPQTLAPGKASKPIPVKCGIRTMVIHWQGKEVACTWNAVVMSGELGITFDVDLETGKRTNVANPKKSTTSKESPGRKSPGTAPIPPNGGRQSKSEAKAKELPRSAELIGLFDPPLVASGSRLLSCDHVALSQCSEAAGSIPSEVLADFIAIRSQRPISSPRACIAIVKEAVANWEARENLPPEERMPTREEIDAMIERERAERIAKQAELRGRK